MDLLEDILYPAIEEINEILDEGGKLAKSPETVLFGDGALLDSIGLVNFIVTAEGLVQDVVGRTVTLASEKAFSRRQSPFRSIGSLADYIGELLAEESQ